MAKPAVASLDIPDIRNRVIELRMMLPSELLDHPGQWRDHPLVQAEAMAASLRQLGQTDALKAYYSQRAGGALVSWDGHLRKTLRPDVPWPVLITDLNDDEADLALAIHDPLSALAGTDSAAFSALYESISTEEQPLKELLDSLMEGAAESLLRDANNGPTTGLERNQSHKIKAVLYTDEVATFERAMQLTGEENRGRAIVQICQEYIGHHDQETL